MLCIGLVYVVVSSFWHITNGWKLSSWPTKPIYERLWKFKFNLCRPLCSNNLMAYVLILIKCCTFQTLHKQHKCTTCFIFYMHFHYQLNHSTQNVPTFDVKGSLFHSWTFISILFHYFSTHTYTLTMMVPQNLLKCKIRLRFEEISLLKMSKCPECATSVKLTLKNVCNLSANRNLLGFNITHGIKACYRTNMNVVQRNSC